MRRERLGCNWLDDGRAEFCVWAPRAEKMEVRVVGPEDRMVEMRAEERGYYRAVVEGVAPGNLYFFRRDGKIDHPDPASRFQPQGVHGPSMAMDPEFAWNDSAWKGLPLEKYLLYEIHVGTFTPEGTFDAILGRLDDLKELGVTALELMPVAQFPGARNWGYDGVYPYAVQNSYGGPQALKRLVDGCHARGLAVVLDVVYNHLGPEGNYLSDFGPYFTARYRTPWGEALNFDGPESDEVRRFFIENALYWITEFHFDALRLDAVHAIVDTSAHQFLEELGERVHERAAELGRQIMVIAESDRNDARLIRGRERGGLGLDGVWNDDFHHAVHALVTGERIGYYADFGRVADLGKAFTDHFVFSGQYSAYRRRRHGNSGRDVSAARFVIFAQNHDQTGNRMLGERLAALASFDDAKLAAAAVLLSPFLPLLFMGEEYGETAPFYYFVSHGDDTLIEAVRRGRKEEFAAFAWRGEPRDPQAESTFLHAKLNWALRGEGRHRTLLEFYRTLIRLRAGTPALARRATDNVRAFVREEEKALAIVRKNADEEILLGMCFGDHPARLPAVESAGVWVKVLDSSEERWLGRGSQAPLRMDGRAGETCMVGPRSVVVYRQGGAG